LRKLGVFINSIFQEPLGFTWGWLIPSGNQTWLWKMVLICFNGKISIYKWWMSHCHVPPLPCLMGGYIKLPARQNDPKWMAQSAWQKHAGTRRLNLPS
jgi:hypothetical protein